MRAKKPDRNKQHFAKGSTFEGKVTELARFDWPPMPTRFYSATEIARLIRIDDNGR